MPRRNLIPLLLLAVLGVGTLAFAVLGASAAPSGATLAVQNASAQTFGTPTGSTSFTMDVVNTVSAGASSGTDSQVRRVAYVPPHRMRVYQVTGSRSTLLGVLTPAAASCSISTYAAVVGGSTPWSPSGTAAFTRTESLAAFDARVPQASATTCAPQSTSVLGRVHERAAVRAGYLVGVRLTVVVPPQTLANGQRAASGTENEALVLLQIGGSPTHALGS